MLNRLTKTKLVAILEIVFGLIGLVYVVIAIFSKTPIYMIIISFLLFILSLIAGLMTIKEIKKGIYLSMIVQLL